MASTAAKAVQGERTRDQVRRLKRTRREAKEFLRETRRLTKRYGKRITAEKLQQIQEATASLETAMLGDDAERLGAALKRLDQTVEKHLGFARRSPGVEYALSIGKALAIALVLRLFVVEAFRIPSGSMIPSLLIGDHIFVNKLSYGVRLPVINFELAHWGGYRRGDVIVFANPQDDQRPFLDRRDYIKRIVGLPGDTVEVKNEIVYVNGVPQPRAEAQAVFPYFDRMGDDGPWREAAAELWKETLLEPDGKAPVTHDVLRDADRPHAVYEGPFRVPAGHLFMMGDNRDNSADGRAGGWFVPFGHVKGRALVIWLSVGKPGFWIWGDNNGLRFERMFHAVH